MSVLISWLQIRAFSLNGCFCGWNLRWKHDMPGLHELIRWSRCRSGITKPQGQVVHQSSEGNYCVLKYESCFLWFGMISVSLCGCLAMDHLQCSSRHQCVWISAWSAPIGTQFHPVHMVELIPGVTFYWAGISQVHLWIKMVPLATQFKHFIKNSSPLHPLLLFLLLGKILLPLSLLDKLKHELRGGQR